jgi:hypothetical protein
MEQLIVFAGELVARTREIREASVRVGRDGDGALIDRIEDACACAQDLEAELVTIDAARIRDLLTAVEADFGFEYAYDDGMDALKQLRRLLGGKPHANVAGWYEPGEAMRMVTERAPAVNDATGHCVQCGRDNNGYEGKPCSDDCPMYDQITAPAKPGELGGSN